MNEGFRNLALLVWALCAVNSNSYAQDSATVITEESSTSAPTSSMVRPEKLTARRTRC